MQFQYIREGDEIYKNSFAIVRKEAELDSFPLDMQDVVVRLIHACGMIDLTTDIAYSKNCVSAGRMALSSGKSIFCDVEMVRSGIIKNFLPSENKLICTINDDRTPTQAKKIGNTRSAAATDLWDDTELAGSIVVIGNAPTALYHLLERLLKGGGQPALIIAMPVGFVGAVESKRLAYTLQQEGKIASEIITIHGRRGGSALASAALNALSKLEYDQ